jgi:hypothetical protein
MGMPQVASFAGGLFNRETPAEINEQSTPGDVVVDQPEFVDPTEPADIDQNVMSEELAESAAEEVDTNPLPTWAEVREAHQTTSVQAPTTASSVPQVIPGAMPESAVYLPTADLDPDRELADEWVEPAASSALEPDIEGTSAAKAEPLESSELTVETTAPASEEEAGAEEAVVEASAATAETVFTDDASSSEAAVEEAPPAAKISYPALDATEGASADLEATDAHREGAVESTEIF